MYQRMGIGFLSIIWLALGSIGASAMWRVALSCGRTRGAPCQLLVLPLRPNTEYSVQAAMTKQDAVVSVWQHDFQRGLSRIVFKRMLPQIYVHQGIMVAGLLGALMGFLASATSPNQLAENRKSAE